MASVKACHQSGRQNIVMSAAAWRHISGDGIRKINDEAKKVTAAVTSAALAWHASGGSIVTGARRHIMAK